MIFLFVLFSSLGNLVRSSFGVGGNLFSLVFLSFWFDPKFTIPVLTFFLIFNRLLLIPSAIKKTNWAICIYLVLGGLIGSFLGSLFLVSINQELLKRLLAVIILMILGYQVYQDRLVKNKIKEDDKSSLKTNMVNVFVGFVSGFVSSGLGVGGGVINGTYLGFKIKVKEVLRNTIITIGFILSFSQVISYSYLNLFSSDSLPYILWSLPFLVLTTYLGEYLSKVLPDKNYKSIFQFILIFSSIMLFFR